MKLWLTVLDTTQTTANNYNLVKIVNNKLTKYLHHNRLVDLYIFHLVNRKGSPQDETQETKPRVKLRITGMGPYVRGGNNSFNRVYFLNSEGTEEIGMCGALPGRHKHVLFTFR